jgi:hypothetical protein
MSLAFSRAAEKHRRASGSTNSPTMSQVLRKLFAKGQDQRCGLPGPFGQKGDSA